MEHSIDKNVIIIVHHSDHFTKVFSHDTAGGLFTSSQDALSRNQDNPQASLFSTLDQLESYRNAEGNFHFKICYPNVVSNVSLLSTGDIILLNCFFFMKIFFAGMGSNRKIQMVCNPQVGTLQ